MKHARARDQIPDYLEGDLDVPARAALERHLAECPSCSEEVRSLRRVVGLLHGLDDPQPRIDLADAVMDRIAAGEAAPPRLDPQRLRQIHVPRLVGTLAAGVAGAALVLFSMGEPTPVQLAAETSDGQKIERGPRSTPETAPRVLQPPPRRRAPAPVFSATRVATRPRASAFAAGVAPRPEILDVAEASPERELDRQIDWLMRDPRAFLRRTQRLGDEQLRRLARRAARRGEAVELAGRLMPIRSAQANQLQGRLLFESLAADLSRRPATLD